MKVHPRRKFEFYFFGQRDNMKQKKSIYFTSKKDYILSEQINSFNNYVIYLESNHLIIYKYLMRSVLF